MNRADAFKAMERATLPDMDKTTIYGITIASMNADELGIALGWALSQAARLAPHTMGKLQS